jgi:hypothetical protein
MEFNPGNQIVKYCLQGMAMEDKGQPEAAKTLFLQAWNEATHDFERYLAANYVARHQASVADQLHWLETALQFALNLDDDGVTSALPSLYARIAACYERAGDHENAAKNRTLGISYANHPTDKGPFYHGTKADMQIGDLLTPGFGSNYQSDLIMNHIYFTAIANGAGLAAALANGDGRERVYIVEPTGSYENDPNVTDKKFPGNPTRSYRTTAPLKIVGEVTDWVRQTPEQIQQWRDRLAGNKGEIIN